MMVGSGIFRSKHPYSDTQVDSCFTHEAAAEQRRNDKDLALVLKISHQEMSHIPDYEMAYFIGQSKSICYT